MSDYEMVVTYLSALVGRFRRDDKGAIAAEYIVVTGVALVAVAVVAAILWAKLKGGAENVDVPSPQAP